MIEREFDDYLALLRGLLRLRKRQCDAIADELRDHMDARLEDLLAEGIPREKAVQIALEEFGDAAGVGQAFLELNRTNQRRWNMKITAASLLTCTALGLAAMAFWPGGGPDVSNKAMAQVGGGAAGPGGGVVPGGPPPGMPQEAERSKEENNQATAQKLAKVQATFSFDQVPVGDMAAQIRELCDVNIIVDINAFEQSNVDINKMLTLNLKNVRMDTALALILKQLPAGYYIHDGIVIITVDEALAAVTEVRVYNVADLVYLDTAWPLDPSHGSGAPGMMGGMGSGMGMGAPGGMGGMPGASGSMAPGGYGGAGGMPGGPGGMSPGGLGSGGGMRGGPAGGIGGGDSGGGAGGPGGVGGVGGPPGVGFPGSGAGPGSSGAPGGFGAPGGGGGRPGPGVGPGGAGGSGGGSGFGGGRPGGSGGGEGASLEATGAGDGAPSGGGSAGASEGSTSGVGGAIPAAGGGESGGPTSGLGMIETISETPVNVLAQMGGMGGGSPAGGPPGGMMGSGGGGGGGMGDSVLPQYFSKNPSAYTPEERRTVDLIHAVTSAVETDSWALQGGSGEIQPFEGLLIIRNTPKAHQGIEMLLQQIRTARMTPRGGIGGLGGGMGGMGGRGMGGMGGGMFSIEGR